jgi:hypothetical protein
MRLFGLMLASVRRMNFESDHLWANEGVSDLPGEQLLCIHKTQAHLSIGEECTWF